MKKWCLIKRLVLCALGLTLCVVLCSCGHETQTGTEGLEYEVWDRSYVVTGYHGSNMHVVIPDTYKDIPVTEVAPGAFEESEIQSIVITIKSLHKTTQILA